jgi:DNA polymerase (family 10)
MRNLELSDIFEEIADLLEIQEANVFRIRAYRRAAEQVGNLSEDAALAIEAGRKISGIGTDLAAKILEAARTGSVAYLDELRLAVPRGVRQMMDLPGVGPRKAKLLHEKLGVDSIEGLEREILSGKILGVPGFQKRTAENLKKGIDSWRAGRSRTPLGRALAMAQGLVAALREDPAVKSIEVAGSLRRRAETVGDIDILVTSDRSEAVMQRFVSLPQARELIARGETKCSILHREGIQVDLRVVEPGAFGAALQYFTGSKAHNIRLRELAVRRKLKINEYGVFDEAGSRLAGATEEELYAALGLPWIPPEIREDGGEIEAALAGRLPRLVETSDIRGDLHAHTDWTDGRASLESLIAAAEAKGYEYVVVSDHSRSTTIARGLTPERVLEQVRAIEELQPRHRIRILTGSECDILADGALDFPDEILARLDVVLAAVHSRFKQPREEMTARICRALENPHVRVLAHPTGRLLGSRDPYEVDLEQVLAVGKAHGKAVEINASPNRLDLRDIHARRAKEMGMLLSIDTDTHHLAELDNIDLGVATARRAWIGPDQVLNAMPLERLLAWTGGPGRGSTGAGGRPRRSKGGAPP